MGRNTPRAYCARIIYVVERLNNVASLTRQPQPLHSVRRLVWYLDECFPKDGFPSASCKIRGLATWEVSLLSRVYGFIARAGISNTLSCNFPLGFALRTCDRRRHRTKKEPGRKPAGDRVIEPLCFHGIAGKLVSIQKIKRFTGYPFGGNSHQPVSKAK